MRSKYIVGVVVGIILIYFSIFGTAGFGFILTGSTEDFTTYTKVDPNNHISVTANHIDFIYRRNEIAYLYKDKGAGHFTDFTHLVTIKVLALVDYVIPVFWMVSNDLGDQSSLQTGGKTFLSLEHYCHPISNCILQIRECNAGTGYYASNSISTGTTYYLTIARSGTAFTCKAYSDAARTNLLFTLSLTLHSTISFRYIFGCNGWDDFATTDTNENYIDNLDLQEQTPTTGNLQVKGYANQIAVQFSAYYVGPSGQGPTVTVPASGYNWSSLAPGTYTVYGTYNDILKNQQVTVVVGQTASATLTFSGTPPPPDIISMIKDFFNNPTVRQLMLIGGLLTTAICGIIFIVPKKRPTPSYW
jgi:hypothetical protein